MSAELKVVPELEDLVPEEGWRIEDVSTLDWALSRLGDLEREIAENEEIARHAMARIQLKTGALNALAKKGADFFRSVIASYAEGHRDELLGGGKKKSRTLLHGSVGWRKTGGRLEVKDREALLEWARSQPVELNLVRIKEEPAVDEVKLHHNRTGEIPPGCDVSPESEELTIKATGGGSHE